MNALFDERRSLIPFRSLLLPQIFTDVLVIGGGVAGLRAAIASSSAGADVIVLSKDELRQSNTAWAQGGVAAVLADAVAEGSDDLASHIADTIDAGAGLCEPAAVRQVVERGARLVEEMIDWGVGFDSDGAGRRHRGREGGHRVHRIYHAGGDATGAAIARTLEARARSAPGVRIFERCFALDLITASDEPGSPVLGAITHHAKHGLQMIWARGTILASGGAGQVYRETTNPRVATADGLAMAYRAGAELADMAFVQFHPTTLYLPGAGRALISEAVRGEGAYLLAADGRRFMRGVHEMAELAPRDVVAMAIARQFAEQGGQPVGLDCRHLTGFDARFPRISAMLARFGINPSRDLIPVYPAAHYMIGGVRTDATGATSVPGLWAAGEVAMTGLNGANRLASNSLLEGLVFGESAGTAAAALAASSGGAPVRPVSVVSDIRPSDHGELDLEDVRSSLRSSMWRNVGIERAGPRLRDACDMIDFWARYTLDKIFDDPSGWETQNMLLVGAAIARSALWREESRGSHRRSDHPEPDDARFLVHDVVRRGLGEVRTIPLAGVAEPAGSVA